MLLELLYSEDFCRGQAPDEPNGEQIDIFFLLPIPFLISIIFTYHIFKCSIYIKKGDFQWTLFQKFLRLSQATRGR